MVLIRDDVKVACEIAVSNSVEYEVRNINKCLNAGYSKVCIISKDEKHLKKIKESAEKELGEIETIQFISYNQVPEFLNSIIGEGQEKVERVRGYRVKVKYKLN
mgnify:FL=1